MKTQRYICIIIFTIFSSCSQFSGEDGVIEVNNNYRFSDDLFIQSIDRFSIHKIGFEIGELSDIKFFEDTLIYVLDKMQKQIGIFNSDFELLRLIKDDIEGNGIGFDPQAIEISHSGEVLVYHTNGYLYRLDLDGNFLGKIELPFWVERIYRTPKGYLVFKNNKAKNFEDRRYHFDYLLLDFEFQLVSSFHPFVVEENVARYWPFLYQPVFIHEDLILVSKALSDTLEYYNVFTGELIKKEILKFSSGSLPASINVDFSNPVQVLEFIENHTFHGGHFYQNDHFMSFMYNGVENAHWYWIDKKNNKKLNIKNLKLLHDGEKINIPYPSIYQDGYMISVIDQESFTRFGYEPSQFEYFARDLLEGKVSLVVIKLKS